MATLRLPPRFKSPLRWLAQASDSDVSGFAEALGVGGNVSSVQSVIDNVAERLPQIAEEDRTSLVHAVLSLSSLRLSEPSSPLSTAESVSELPELELGKAARNKLRARIESILATANVTALSKAADLLTDHEHVFLKARIITDVRPIFTDNPQIPPAGAVVQHQLRVTFDSPSGRSSTYFALDDVDIDALHEAVVRAQQKSAAIRSMLASAAIAVFEPWEPSDE